MSEETAEVASRGAQVSNFLVKKDKFSALQLSLKNPPINSKSEELKVKLLLYKLNLVCCDALRD
jgi:hypothetical protein